MSTISRVGIVPRQRIRSQQLLNVIDALDGSVTTDIVMNGNVTGKFIPSSVYHVSPNHSGLSSPYFTSIPSAITAAAAGILVVVHPGTYQSNIILKHLVDIFCYPNVTLRNDNTNVASFAGSVITDNGQSVSCSVLGYADIIKEDDGTAYSEAAAIGIYGPNSNVLIEANLVQSNSWSAFIVASTGAANPTRPSGILHADRVVGVNHIACDCDTADQTVYAREIISYHNHAVWCMTTVGVSTVRTAHQTVHADRIILDTTNTGAPTPSCAVIAMATGAVIETHGNIETNINYGVVSYVEGVTIKVCDGVVRNTWNNATAYPIYTQPYSGRQALVSLRNVSLITDHGSNCIKSDVADTYVLVYGRVAANASVDGNIILNPGASVDVIPLTTDMF